MTVLDKVTPLLKITPINNSDEDNSVNGSGREPVHILTRTPSPAVGILKGGHSPTLHPSTSSSARATQASASQSSLPSSRSSPARVPSPTTSMGKDKDERQRRRDSAPALDQAGANNNEHDGPDLETRRASTGGPSSVSWAPVPKIDRGSDGGDQQASTTSSMEGGRTMPLSHSAPAFSTPAGTNEAHVGNESTRTALTLSRSSTTSLSQDNDVSKRARSEEDEEDEAWEANRSSRRASVTHAVTELRRQLGLGGGNGLGNGSGSGNGPEDPVKRPPPITPGRTPLVEELEVGTDPLDWSHRFKIWATTCYCIMIMSTTFGSSSYAAVTPTVQQVFGVPRTVALLGTSLYVLGFAVGPLIWAPTSEVFGRKPVYLGSFVALTCFGIGVAFAQNMTTIVVCRFLSGVCGASALNNVAASISDMTRVRNRLRYNTAYRLVSFGGPTLGPVVSTFALRAGWRWALRLNPLFSAFALILYAFTVPESHRPTLLRWQQRARERVLRAQSEDGAAEMGQGVDAGPGGGALEKQEMLRQPRGPSLLQRYKIACTRPWKLLTEPLVIIVCAYTSLLYGLLYGILSGFPLIWQEIRGRNEEYASLVYLALLGGFAGGALFIGCWFQDRSFKRRFDAGQYTPEARIGPAVWASFLVPIGLFVFGWTSPYDELVGEVDVHFVVPCLALVVFAAGMGIVFNSWLSYLSDAYATETASAMASATFTRSLLGAAFPLFMRELLLTITIQGAFSLFGGLAVMLCLAGVWFARKGGDVRERSPLASSAGPPGVVASSASSTYSKSAPCSSKSASSTPSSS